MKLYAKTITGNTISVELEECSTVKDFKEKINNELERYPGKLIRNGVVLSDDQSLSDIFNIETVNSTTELDPKINLVHCLERKLG